MRGELVKEVTFKMNLANSYTEADSTLAIPMDRLGLYEYVITVPGKQLTVSNRFSVSRLAALTRSQTNNPEVLVTDLESGKPIEGATVIYYKTNMMNGTIQRQGEVKTDRLGIAILPAKKKIEHIRPYFAKTPLPSSQIYILTALPAPDRKRRQSVCHSLRTGASTGRGKTYSSKGSLM